jgi:hypothetical protein
MGIFALAAVAFWFLSAASCFLDLSFDFGDLSPMVFPPAVEEDAMFSYSLT